MLKLRLNNKIKILKYQVEKTHYPIMIIMFKLINNLKIYNHNKINNPIK